MCDLKNEDIDYCAKSMFVRYIIIIIIIILILLKSSNDYNSYIELKEDYNNLLQQKADLSITNEELNQSYDYLLDNYNELIDKEKTKTIDTIEKYDYLKTENKVAYLYVYKSTVLENEDPPETIYDVTTDDEFNFICRVVQAESGICDFDGKVNVATTIFNRYYSEAFPNDWNDLLRQGSQYTTVSNGSYLKQNEISQEVIDAVEYAYLFGSENVGDSTYFHSGSSNWHENNLELVYQDSWHKFYRREW